MKNKVLILYDYFDPAYKAGGPIRSLVNLVKLMEEELDLYVLTTNQDHDGTLLQVVTDQWISYGKASRVNYLSAENRGYASIKKIILDLNPDSVYINGIYSLLFVVNPLRILKGEKNTKIVIAPRGMLQTEALSIKPLKKRLYLAFLKVFLLRKEIYWQVTTDQEKNDLYDFLDNHDRVILLGNVPAFDSDQLQQLPSVKKVKVFGTVALISPMKNIHLVLKALTTIKDELKYHIYGPVKDQSYWEECQELIRSLPQHIQVTYQGEIEPSEVGKVISAFDFYIQPSKSENFGHSIFEAFNQAIPVIISDQTPWRNLQELKAGWDVCLDDPGSLEGAINEAIRMEDKTYLEYRKGARKVAERYMQENDFVKDYLELFDFGHSVGV